jgi:hypothetical protein
MIFPQLKYWVMMIKGFPGTGENIELGEHHKLKLHQYLSHKARVKVEEIECLGIQDCAELSSIMGF